MLHLTFTQKVIPWEKLFFLEFSACIKLILFLPNLRFNYNRFVDLPTTSWTLASSCYKFGEIQVQKIACFCGCSLSLGCYSLWAGIRNCTKPLNGYQGGSFGFITMVLKNGSTIGSHLLTMVLQKWVDNWFWSINHGFPKMGPKLVLVY